MAGCGEGGSDSEPEADAMVPPADAAVDASADARRPPQGEPDGSKPVDGPLKAGFELVTPSGVAPLFEEVNETATGSVRTTYDWGEGAGFEPATSHRYRTAGTFTVKQSVEGRDGAKDTVSKQVTVTSFVPVKFSATDKTAKLVVTGDGYELEQLGSAGEVSGGRSDDAIAPGSGVFYFEVERLAERFNRVAVGIATAAASLSYPFNGPGGGNDVAVLLADGSTSADGTCTGGPLDPAQTHTGFVVDYRSSSPTLILLQAVAGVPTAVAQCHLNVSAPVFIYYSAERAAVTRELRVNTGQDTANFPFHYEQAAVRNALTTSGDAAAAQAITFGFARSNPGRLDSPPELAISGPTTVAAGDALTLTAMVKDREDGDHTLDAAVHWIDTSLPHHQWTPVVGASFPFTSTKLGVHPVLASVQDLDGVVTTKIVNVTVQGTLPVETRAQLVLTPEATQAGITVSNDGLSARFNTSEKDGLRGNQGILGKFWYFEVHRNSPPRNMGMGLVTADGEIVPYEFDVVPWSCSINVLGDGSVYKNLIVVPGAGSWQPFGDPDHADYGFAVDYRAQNPRVYVLIAGRVQATLDLKDVWVPLYPMLYGNGPGGDGYVQAPFDYTVNFGATPFAMDPVAVLTAAQVDLTGFQRGWGASAH